MCTEADFSVRIITLQTAHLCDRTDVCQFVNLHLNILKRHANISVVSSAAAGEGKCMSTCGGLCLLGTWLCKSISICMYNPGFLSLFREHNVNKMKTYTPTLHKLPAPNPTLEHPEPTSRLKITQAAAMRSEYVCLPMCVCVSLH